MFPAIMLHLFYCYRVRLTQKSVCTGALSVNSPNTHTFGVTMKPQNKGNHRQVSVPHQFFTVMQKERHSIFINRVINKTSFLCLLYLSAFKLPFWLSVSALQGRESNILFRVSRTEWLFMISLCENLFPFLGQVWASETDEAQETIYFSDFTGPNVK